jgi:hypothetical protein
VPEARDHAAEHEQRQGRERQTERERRHPGDQRHAAGRHGDRLRRQLEARLADHRGGEDREDHETDCGTARHAEVLSQEDGRHRGEQAEHRVPGEAGERRLHEHRADLYGDPQSLGPQPGAARGLDRIRHGPDADRRHRDQRKVDPKAQPQRRSGPLRQQARQQRATPQAAHGRDRRQQCRP